jgi:hypothetical protein
LYPSLPKTQSSTWTKQHLPDQIQLPTLWYCLLIQRLINWISGGLMKSCPC